MTHTPPLVLVADDEISAATMLKHVFEREGYRVVITSNGVDTLEIAESQLPNLILLDIQMPQMDGFEVLRHLRENPKTSVIPTIVVSARARKPSEIALGLNIGADDYIAKPFAPQELLARARSKMRARQLEESLQKRSQELEILLRISDELNHHLEFNELFALVLYLVMDLLPGDIAFIAKHDENGQSEMYRFQAKAEQDVDEPTRNQILTAVQQLQGDLIWDESESPQFGYANGMALSLTHDGNQLGWLLMASSQKVFGQNELKLFKGIARQTALALQNATLYEIQANYATHLEKMVAKRTEELQQTQQMLFRSEKLASIGHLAASIAHEINNPLQPIQLNLEHLIEDGQAGQPIDQELIEMTQQSVQRISRIVRQLLEFTKSSSSITTETVSIQKIIRNIVRLNQKALEHSGIDVLEEHQSIPDIEANKDQLEQVFMNIILNAKAAMEPGGRITIRTWHTDSDVYIQFEDDGSGIPPTIINRIFEPFVSTKPDGTGLGLFVTYGIIEKHQGNIDVQSEVGKGTTFTITLPYKSKVVG